VQVDRTVEAFVDRMQAERITNGLHQERHALLADAPRFVPGPL
jgi:hypothetical protein